ncbi:MAG: 23S rRNA (uracil(1939)-C(5))-methyltransferase RlmD [Acidobacteriaceae bacterium]
MKLRIEKAIYGGSGLARIPKSEGALADKAIFVPLTLPNELVEAHAVADKRSFLEGALDAVLEASPGRIAPGCPYFPTCGGCQYQHANYATQAEMKLEILRETLTRAHIAAPERIALLAGEPWGYRNRIRLHVRYRPQFELCYREGGSNRDLPVEQCPIAAPLLQRALRVLEEAALQLPSGLLEQAEFFCDGGQTALMVSLWAGGGGAAATAAAWLPTLAAAVMATLPECRGMALFASEQGGHRQRGRGGKQVRGALLASDGDTTLRCAVGDLSFQVSAGSFFQINRFLLPEMLQLVTGGRRGKLAWDLYAGVGLFARALGSSFAQIVAVEGSPSSSHDLRRNLAGVRHHIAASSTLQFLQAETRHKTFGRPALVPELIVVDPPRAGLGQPVCELLAHVKAREIVYVSCDPATLARDLQALLLSGYRLERLTLVDLFPQTFHLETVAVLVR